MRRPAKSEQCPYYGDLDGDRVGDENDDFAGDAAGAATSCATIWFDGGRMLFAGGWPPCAPPLISKARRALLARAAFFLRFFTFLMLNFGGEPIMSLFTGQCVGSPL